MSRRLDFFFFFSRIAGSRRFFPPSPPSSKLARDRRDGALKRTFSPTSFGGKRYRRARLGGTIPSSFLSFLSLVRSSSALGRGGRRGRPWFALLLFFLLSFKLHRSFFFFFFIFLAERLREEGNNRDLFFSYWRRAREAIFLTFFFFSFPPLFPCSRKSENEPRPLFCLPGLTAGPAGGSRRAHCFFFLFPPSFPVTPALTEKKRLSFFFFFP